MNTDVLQYVKDIVPQIEKYLVSKREVSENWMLEFGDWLAASEDLSVSGDYGESQYRDVLAGMQLIDISNILRRKLNKFVTDTPFATFMDYQFLLVVREHEEMTKSELISANNMEMSSGIEVVKRLLTNEWLSEKPNPRDGRSKLIMITENGKQLVSKFHESAQSIYISFTINLSSRDKNRVFEALALIKGYSESDRNNMHSEK